MQYLIIRSGDKSVQAALLNNLASISHRSNLNDARKKLKSATQIDKTKLSRHQRFTLLLNQVRIIIRIVESQISVNRYLDMINYVLRPWFYSIRINVSLRRERSMI